MDAVAASLAAIALQHGVLASHLQMALTRQRVETEAQGLLTLLETARQAGANPPHLGNRVDTYA